MIDLSTQILVRLHNFFNFNQLKLVIFSRVTLVDHTFVPEMTPWQIVMQQKYFKATSLDKIEKEAWSTNRSLDPEGMDKIWTSIKDSMFSLDPAERQLGLGNKGVSKYWSSNCNQVNLDLNHSLKNCS